jgi:hypothetical protein
MMSHLFLLLIILVLNITKFKKCGMINMRFENRQDSYVFICSVKIWSLNVTRNKFFHQLQKTTISEFLFFFNLLHIYIILWLLGFEFWGVFQFSVNLWKVTVYIYEDEPLSFWQILATLVCLCNWKSFGRSKHGFIWHSQVKKSAGNNVRHVPGEYWIVDYPSVRKSVILAL